MRNAVWVAESPKVSRKTGPKALISPHAAKQTVNDTVPRMTGVLLTR